MTRALDHQYGIGGPNLYRSRPETRIRLFLKTEEEPETDDIERQDEQEADKAA